MNDRDWSIAKILGAIALGIFVLTLIGLERLHTQNDTEEKGNGDQDHSEGG